MPKQVLQRMADPRDGVAAQHEFFSLAAVHKWLKDNGPQPVWKPLLPEPKWAWTPEEWERRAEQANRAKAAMQAIRDAIKPKTIGEHRPRQEHHPEKLLEALNSETHSRRSA